MVIMKPAISYFYYQKSHGSLKVQKMSWVKRTLTCPSTVEPPEIQSRRSSGRSLRIRCLKEGLSRKLVGIYGKEYIGVTIFHIFSNIWKGFLQYMDGGRTGWLNTFQRNGFVELCRKIIQVIQKCIRFSSNLSCRPGRRIA